MGNRLKFASRIKSKGFFALFPIDDIENSEYILLWRSVLDVSLYDLVKGKLHYKEDWNELLDWFDPDNYDFQTVCGFSGLNPESVYGIMNYCIKNAEYFKKETKWNDIIRNTLLSNQNPEDWSTK